MQTICYVAGHSGGHIIPSVTHALKNNNTKILFFATNAELDKKILGKYNFLNTIYLPVTNIPANKLLLPKFCVTLVYAFFKSLYTLKKNKVKQVITMGGLVAIPVCFAAKLLSIPIALYELNVEPGKTINLLSKITDNINICFSSTQKYFPTKQCNLVSYPIRFDAGIKNITQEQARAKINFTQNLKTVLILGGSQGSLFLNNLIKSFVTQNSGIKFQVIHQTGPGEFNWQKFYAEHNIPAINFDYHHEPEFYYIAADLIICRSGAGTLAEVIFFEKKCITIPLDTNYTSHQIINALELEKQYPDKIKVIKQSEITTAKISQQLQGYNN